MKQVIATLALIAFAPASYAVCDVSTLSKFYGISMPGTNESTGERENFIGSLIVRPNPENEEGVLLAFRGWMLVGNSQVRTRGNGSMRVLPNCTFEGGLSVENVAVSGQIIDSRSIGLWGAIVENGDMLLIDGNEFGAGQWEGEARRR